MAPQDLLKYFKTKTAIARAARIAPSSVSEWFEHGAVPVARQYQFQVLTNGALCVDAHIRKEASQ